MNGTKTNWEISGYRTHDGRDASIRVSADDPESARDAARRRSVEPQVVRELAPDAPAGPTESVADRRRAA